MHHLEPSLSSRMEMRESRMNSMLCSRATEECQQESLISHPRVMLGNRFGSELIRSKVWNMASTLWMPYCSRTSPHFLSATFSADGWWWTEKRAPIIISPSILATRREAELGTTDLSYFPLDKPNASNSKKGKYKMLTTVR